MLRPEEEGNVPPCHPDDLKGDSIDSTHTSVTPKHSWAPTMVMTLEFKFPIPKQPSPDHSARTIAVFSSGRFINDPQGRHDTYVELWTAPSNISEGEVRPDWRESQRCLCVATQMALLVSMDVNIRKGNNAGGAKL
ncbi:hypothetical protein NLI96_g1473 [Meripilus lineatus]|uniref:Uncharacterized protein n=1 Tax=Meripilus lineatus TaxID=2056292 RepID=A0AAD5VA03_9APHY|nr:hypothetical protein NLI96_g1473 [Physisporinus lineatus]